MDKNMIWDTAVIGAGPAGLSAALAAEHSGAQKVLLLERDSYLGGILPQCIHNGFGLHRFNEELTGSEYAHRDAELLANSSVTRLLRTFVTDIVNEGTEVILQVVRKGSIELVRAHSVVLAMGCRERTAGAISLAGTRPSGIFTAGTVQRFMNMQNISVGNRVLIVGSGDIGLIMARRLTLEGAQVLGVTEIMPFPGGLNRNIHQCLEDFNIPLYLSTGVAHVYGNHRLEGAVIAPLDDKGNLDIKHARDIHCDTILLSVGLIPENELSRRIGVELDPRTQGPLVNEAYMTSVPGVFACGNVLHVHDVADFVSEEAQAAGEAAARWAAKSREPGSSVHVKAGDGIRYVLPQRIDHQGPCTLSFRVSSPIESCRTTVGQEGKTLWKQNYIKLMPSEMIRIPLHIKKMSPLEVRCEPR